MHRVLLATAVVVALLLTPIAAGAANPDYERWGWSEPAGPNVQFQWGEPMPRTRLSDDYVANGLQRRRTVPVRATRRRSEWTRRALTVFDLQ